MAINIAGTYAIGDYLASEIANARTLLGAAPQVSPGPIGSAPSDSPTTPARPDYRADALTQGAANTAILFGTAHSNAAASGSLAPLPSETPQQIEFVTIQSSNIAAEFSNIATLFGSLGLGTRTDANA